MRVIFFKTIKLCCSADLGYNRFTAPESYNIVSFIVRAGTVVTYASSFGDLRLIQTKLVIRDALDRGTSNGW